MHKQTLVMALGAIFTAILITSMHGDLANMRGTLSIRRQFTIVQKDTSTICHVPSDPDITMEVNEHALTGHLKHDDYLGPCQGGSSSSPSSDSDSSPVRTAPVQHSFGTYRGSGLKEHATIIHSVFANYGLHKNAPYDFTLNHENIRPESFASEEEKELWTLEEHAACCSIFRYLQRLRDLRHSLHPGYVDWITKQVAQALGEDPVEIKAALLGLSHAHPSTSNLIRSITQAGCLANPYVSGRMNVADLTHTQPVQEPGHAASESPLIIRQNEADGELSFAIMDGETVFTDYGISHTKEMHLLVVRDDLRHYHHLHPTRDEEGTWHVPFTPSAGGIYWIYADFVDQEGNAHIIRFERTYEGDPGAHGIEKVPEMKKIHGQLRITLEIEPYPQGTLFTYHIRDAYGNAPYLEQYLDAMGHGVLISTQGDLIHIHPSPAGDALVFHIPDPPDDFYRVFTQVQIGGEVMTVEFDWEPHIKTQDS